MKKLIAAVSVIVLTIMAFLITSFPSAHVAPIDGEVYALMPGTIIHGIQSAMRAESGTRILSDGTRYVFMWQIEDGLAFVGINSNKGMLDVMKDVFGNGNYVNPRTMKELWSILSQKGWTEVPPSAVPTIIQTAVLTSSNWLVTLSQSMTTLLIMPTGWFDAKEVLKNIPGYNYKLYGGS